MLTVGQKLWFVGSMYKPDREITIERVGRKWAYSTQNAREMRIDLNSLKSEIFGYGHYSHNGQCYLSREEYEKKRELNRVWEEFVSRLTRNHPPKGITLNQINSMAEICGVTIPPRGEK